MDDTFYATLAFPLDELTLPGTGADWAAGAYLVDRAAHYSVEARLRFYANTEPLESHLDPERRLHRTLDLTDDHLRVVAAELVRTPDRWSTVAGYLVVHLESTPEAPEIAAIAQLGRVARPATEPAQRVLTLIAESDGGASHWSTANVPRVASLCLSGIPSADATGLVRSHGSTPHGRRLADLVTLPAYGRDVPVLFETEPHRPTPSYLVAGSGSAVAVVRLRSLREDHVLELRTHWFDAMLVEITQRDTAVALVERVRDLVPAASGRQWRDFERQFRSWRTRWAWQASTDHPLESGLAGLVRTELATDRLVARVESEIADHAQAAELRADENLNKLAIVVSLVALVLTVLQLFV